MERALDKFLYKKFSIKSITFSVVDIVFLLFVITFGLIIRIKLFPIESADYTGFLAEWMGIIKQFGPIRSLKYEISNYTSPYMYLMCLVSGFDNTLISLKSISTIFDMVAAVAVFAIVFELVKDTRKAVIGMSITWLCPTVFIDSAYWCQCDSIYTSIILWALYFFFKDRSTLCMVFIGIAFSFKLQTLFIIPFLIIMYLKKRTIRIADFIFVPAVYVLLQLPAWFCGRPFKDLMLIYINQTDYYPWGTLAYPNIYVFLDETMTSMHYTKEITAAGTYLAIIALGVLAYYIYTEKFSMTNSILISLALFSVGICVYLLPHMHDRYGFLIDLLAIIYGVINPKRIIITVGFVIVSVVTFMPYLIGVYVMKAVTVALILLMLLLFVGYDTYKQIKAAPMS